jgi:hypothetical protein
MIHSTLQVFKKSSLSALALSGIVFVGSLLPQQAKAYIPAYTTFTPADGNTTSPGVSSSFGFLFDTATNVSIDALGFAGDTRWGNNRSYTVKLWSYINGGGTPGDYTPIATATFTEGNSYTLQSNYYWQPLAGGPLSLPDTGTVADPTNLRGYVISAIGDFSGVNGYIFPQIVSTATTPAGSVTFDPKIDTSSFFDISTSLVEINGFNDQTDPNGFFEVPIYLTAGLGDNGYFNANLSFAPVPPVPGPLPMFGAAAGFAWSRRLRKRIQATK